MSELGTGRLVLDASAVVLMLTEVANALWRLQRAGQLAAACRQRGFTHTSPHGLQPSPAGATVNPRRRLRAR